ncbi:MAG TPA: hypothetical protein VFV93_11170 [Thermomicrobiales bacterium]|nr:hypothetical protein [Thermomicrobiales bacterium]
MYRHRLRSPLRLLSATMSALMVVALAAIAGPWLIVLAPVVAGLFLLAPPIGIYRHDETPAPRTGVRIEAVPLDDDSANTLRFRLVLVNPGDVPASNFRIRLLVPHALVPASASSRLLGPIQAGAIGQNWFIDSTYDAIAVTFRSGKTDGITCPPAGRLDLADLNLPSQAHPLDVTLDYQISGGTAAPALDRLHLRWQ